MQPRSRHQPTIDPRLDLLVSRLWPQGTAVTVGRDRPGGRRPTDAFVAVPNAQHPRFLVPVGPRRAMASVLTSYAALRRRRTRVARRMLAVASRAGLVGPVVGQTVRTWAPQDRDGDAPADAAFTGHVRACVGDRSALTAIGVPEMDMHYKPTIQVFDRSGGPLGFAKIGWTAATTKLVRRETEALRAWRQQPGRHRPRVPAVLASGTWNGHDYVVTAPLPERLEGVDDADPLTDVARELAGPLEETTLAGGRYWAHVRQRLRTAPDGALSRAVGRAVAVIEDLAGQQRWRFGRWHGDWTSWNVARAAGAIHVWDWEHSTACAPWGFDLLHWRVTVPHLRQRVPYASSVAAAARTGRPPGVEVAGDVLLLAYLVEMGLRSLELREVPGTDEHGGSGHELYPGLTGELNAFAAALGARNARTPREPRT